MITYKGRQIPETSEEIVEPSHTALIVHEMLNDFTAKGGKGTRTTGRPVDVSGILGNMVTLIDRARKAGVKVMYVRMTSYADDRTLNDPMIQRSYKTTTDPNRSLPSGTEGTWGWEILDEVKPQDGEIVVSKFRPDSFIGTNLELLLRSNAIRTIVIVGIGAEAGIVPTATHAFNLGFFVVVPGDCILGTEAAWLNVAMRFIGRVAIVEPTQDLVKVWSDGTVHKLRGDV